MREKFYTTHGFTLLEFLIALALSAFVLAGACKIYMHVLNQYYLTQNIASLQHRMQLAYLILKKNILLAGDTSCFSEHTEKNLSAIIFDKIQQANKKSGTDTLSIQRCIKFKNEIQWNKVSFFIKNTHRKSSNQLPIFSLYRKISDAPSEELIPGISNMDICYITSPYNSTASCITDEKTIQQKTIRGVRITLVIDSLTLNQSLSKYFLIIAPIKGKSKQ